MVLAIAAGRFLKGLFFGWCALVSDRVPYWVLEPANSTRVKFEGPFKGGRYLFRFTVHSHHPCSIVHLLFFGVFIVGRLRCVWWLGRVRCWLDGTVLTFKITQLLWVARMKVKDTFMLRRLHGPGRGDTSGTPDDVLPLPRNSHPHDMHEHARCFHSQTYPHLPGSRGVGTPRVIRHRDFLPLLRHWGRGSAGTGQWLQPGRRGVGC